MKDYGVHCGRLKMLLPVLKKWIKLNRNYAERMEWKDCGWWSNERATTSILAASAWMCGGVALEEFSTRKHKRKKAGRCDLLFKIRNEKFACEIKQVFFTKLKDAESLDDSKIKQSFESACDDAKALDSEEGRRLGICFVTPRFHPLHPQDPSIYVERIMQNKTELDFHATAWFFPKDAIEMEWAGHNRIYPGIIVLIREIENR